MKEYIILDDFLDDETMASANAQGYLRELVRCGECKHFVENTWECSRLCDRFGDEYSDARVYPDWFCADGERKDGERDV